MFVGIDGGIDSSFPYIFDRSGEIVWIQYGLNAFFRKIQSCKEVLICLNGVDKSVFNLAIAGIRNREVSAVHKNAT